MYCEHCGLEIAHTPRVCPRCGTNIVRQPKSNLWQQPPITNYGQYPEAGVGGTSSYQHGYTAPPETPPLYRKDTKEFPRSNRQTPPYLSTATPVHHVGLDASSGFNVIRVSTKNNNTLIVEIILSLFGLFGVGWLLAGETTAGTILLIGSVFIYWPLLIFGTIFTFGLGLICLGPFAIGAIILNILLLNKVLDRQSTHYVIASQPAHHMHMPPQQ
jgi:hypothetical protein